MNQEIKERWLTALRSGEYEQAEGYLNISAKNESDNEYDGFCCLGVLCELAVADGVIQKQRYAEEDFYEYGDPESDDFDHSVLPRSVKEWAGLSDSNPSVNDLSEDENPEFVDNWIPISEPNDNGASFARIADMIERDL